MTSPTKDWQPVAKAYAGDDGMPGTDFSNAEARAFLREGRWRVTCRYEHGSNQGYLEVHRSHEVEGRGDSYGEAIADAIDAIDDACGATGALLLRAALRDLGHKCEDAYDA